MRNPNDRFFSQLGLAMRAGKLVTGDEAALTAVRSREAKLLIIASDASENTKKKYKDKCTTYGVKVIEGGSRDRLGASIGKESRVVLAVVDLGFARLLTASYENSPEVSGIE
jgi:ribosomal protein L7Ae-like RNA K-turn-binding protein